MIARLDNLRKHLSVFQHLTGITIDSFEQRMHQPKRRQRAYCSGKKKGHTQKSQMVVDQDTGRSWTCRTL